MTIWNAAKLLERGCRNVPFGSATVAFRDASGAIYTTHSRMISAIILGDNIKVKPEHYYEFDRLTFMRGASYGPGLLVPHEYHEQYGIPILQPEAHNTQMAIIADNKLIITMDYNISSIKNLDSTTILRPQCPRAAGNST